MYQVMLLGDSLRMGYEPIVRKMLEGRAEVSGPSENGRWAGYTLNSFRFWIPSMPKPDLIHWNNGLWDLGDDYHLGRPFSLPEEYESALERMVTVINKTFPEAKIIMATTMPTDNPDSSDIESYNEILKKVAERHNIPVDDLFPIPKKDPSLIGPDHIHLTPEGFETVAQKVVQSMEEYLPKAAEAKEPSTDKVEIRRMKEVTGLPMSRIAGQFRYGVGYTDFQEFYEISEYADKEGYQGNQIVFCDYMSGEVFTPFAKEKNVAYRGARFIDGKYYFLKGDFNSKEVSVFKYIPGTPMENVLTIPMADVGLYNLSITGTSLHLISQGDSLECYYPERFTVSLEPEEVVVEIDGDKIYCSSWVEEGVVNDVMTADYKYYEKLIIKDKTGKVLSDEIGSVDRGADGKWWLS